MWDRKLSPKVVRRNLKETFLSSFKALRPEIDWGNVVQMPGCLEGKTIMLTGGANGLGKEILWWTAVFGGAKVFFFDIDDKAGEATASYQVEHIKRTDGAGQAIFNALDVSDPATCKMAFDSVLTQSATVDVLINNAGIGCVDTIHQAQQEQFWKMLKVNLGGFLNLSQPFVNHVVSGRGDGSIPPEAKKKIITICSIGGITTLAERFSYGTSKYALTGAIRSSAVDLGQELELISINPGRIDTDMAQAKIAGASEQERPIVAWEMAASQRNCAMLKPRDIGAFVAYLSSDDPAASLHRNSSPWYILTS